MRTLMVATTAVLALSSCDEGRKPSAPGAAQPSLAELKLKVEDWERLLGEDAYDRPEIEQVMRDLARIGQGSADYEEARKLLERLRAKKRIARQAKEPVKPEQVIGPSHVGPIAMPGAAPASAEAVKKIGVGSSRGELVSAYGRCLVRQTWFKGQGGPTVEMFHVAPDCRAHLGKKVFRVANDRVDAAYEGTLDGVLTSASRDTPRPTQPDGSED